MKEKIKLLDEYKASQVELDKFTKSLPAKITENEFINKVTDTAVKNNIQIESYTPGHSRNDTRYDLNQINL